MRIKARMGMSLDGFIAAPDGIPSLLKAQDFVSGQSHGYPEFIEGCDAVVMGRQTFLPALGPPQLPWGDMQVFVLTSTPLPAGTPSGVVVSEGGPKGLIEQLRSRGSDGDVHLVGGPRTIQAIAEVGALDSLEVVVLPIILGAGTSLWPPDATSSSDASGPRAPRIPGRLGRAHLSGREVEHRRSGAAPSRLTASRRPVSSSRCTRSLAIS